MNAGARLGAASIAVLALAGLTPFGIAGAQPTPLPDTSSRMRLDLESLSPRVITADTPTITVTGKVTNTGDRRIDEIRVQLRRGDPLATEQELRQARDQPTESAVSPFVNVADSLAPGQSAPISLNVGVHEGDGSLRIDKPGVYPLLVNVNGRPEFSGRARLATTPVLLPALSVPGGANLPQPPTPSRLTVLWPLIDDHPRLVTTAADGRAVLSDDDLAASLSPGGRLYGLTSAVQQASLASPGLLEALCFAVDPDLVQTATLMTDGYHVQSAGGAVDGRGAAAAKAWLDRLRTLTADRCVLPLPYADPDLVALSGASEVELEKLALSSTNTAPVVELAKPGPPLSGVFWPVAGALDERTAADLAASGPITVLADPAHLRKPEGSGPYTMSGAAAAGARAVPIDGLVSGLLDGVPADRAASVQNGLAALVFRTQQTAGGGRSILIAPPRRWAAPAGELTVFLQTLQQVVAGGLATPRPLTELVSAPSSGTASGFEYSTQDGISEVAPTVLGQVVRIHTAQRDLSNAMKADDTKPVDPANLLDPIKLGLLRATSSAWRGRPDLAERAVGQVSDQLDALRAQVTVSNTGRPLTLASGNSPIPVLLTNATPVSVRVRIKLADTPGLRPDSIPDMWIPAGSSINPYLPVEVTRAGRFTVDVSLSTPGGTPLGSTARLELTSTKYGSITLIITGTAAGALFLLAGLRIFRRVRAARMAGSAQSSQGPIEDGVG